MMNSGYSVSMNSAGDRVAIGALSNDGGGITRDTCAFTSTPQVRGPSSALTSMEKQPDDQSGYSISMNSAGDRVAIGAYYNDGTASEAGHVRIYSSTVPGPSSALTSMEKQQVTTRAIMSL